ncbi:MAG TPA: hypothetical protein ENG45_00825 [Candidatus Aenigmarchaeota archaeon]|nr:hypothetical protein [Candidatus Aenigmarchaeota archaeon]
MRKLIVPLALIPLVFFSGCLRQGGKGAGGGTQGIVISSFAPDVSVIPPGETVTFSLDVENVGDKEGTSVTAELYGVPFDGDYAWRCVGETTPVDSLYPPDPVSGTPGEVYTFTWDCTAPNVPTEITQEFYVDVSYGYETDATGTLMVAEEDYLKSLSSKERQEFYSTGGLKQLSVSSAPVTVDVVIPRPLILREDKSSSLTIRVIIRNVGGGKVDKDTISIKQGDIKGIDCEIPEEGVKLIRGEERTLRCSIENIQGIDKKAEVPFSIRLTYTYIVTSSATVTIRPE